MYLKALEIQGFKSFPDKTVLTFGEEITAVVGPNGSGKSNISDAISWVMGEQSARTLRGSKMEDVIFSGTEKRSSVGFAQVTLVLDNSDGGFPGANAGEIMVTRRYYRSGESEYYINKQSVRLKDINELFMDTGLGREGYALIGQGRIDEILSVRSADRREIFEEAAGISRYRHRKEEAERRLERTEENLVRIHDKIAELEFQIQPLREQAETAKRYLVLRDELRLLEISVWLEKLDEIKRAVLKLQADCAAARAEKAAADAKLEQLFAENEQFSQKMQDNDMEQERVRSEMQSCQTQVSDQENAIAVQDTIIAHNHESVALLEREIAEQAVRSSSLQAQLAQQQERVKEIDGRCTVLQEELHTLLEKARAAAERADSAADKAKSLQAREALAVAEAADAKSRLSAVRAGIEQLAERDTAIVQELSSANERLSAAREEEAAARSMLEEAKEEAASLANMMQGHTLRLEKRAAREEGSKERVHQLTMEQTTLQSRLTLLKEMEKEYEGFHKAVRVVMQAAQRGTLRGIHGPVASLMRTDSRFTVALEIALGAGMQSIVVDREEDGKRAITLLKQREGGRGTFLPLNVIRGSAFNENGVEEEPGFVGLAVRLASYEEQYEEIFQDLLGRTVVVEDLDFGIKMARKYQQRFRIVTLDGQVINRGGAMTGGSVSRSAGILSRANELEELKQRDVLLDKELSAARKEFHTLSRECNAARYELEVTEGRRRRAEDAVLRSQGELDRHSTLVETLRNAVEACESERASLAERMAERHTQMAGIEKEIREREREAAALHGQIEETQSGRSDLLNRSATLAEQVTQQREALARLSAERETTLRAAEDLAQVQRDMEGDRASRECRIGEYRAAITCAEEEIQRCTEAMTALRLRSRTLEETLTELRNERMRLEQERGTIHQRMKSYSDSVQLAAASLTALENKITVRQLEEKQILDKLWESYELSHSAAAAQRIELESVARTNRRIGDIKREISSLGNVNIGAIEEFERVNGRYTYLTEQRDDVEKAKGELLGIIDALKREMTAIFSQQFDLIHQAFQETFRDLFGGGFAALELEDSQNILDCGIEIKVQPPGKSLKTLTLLSGGEKAFVAIALYFAILKIHPTPFCVMDEIEAALDDANVVRYASYMRTISDKTQFIVITHRRGTMEEADVLYGVTMQEKGVSKLLKLNLNDVEQELKLK